LKISKSLLIAFALILWLTSILLTGSVIMALGGTVNGFTVMLGSILAGLVVYKVIRLDFPQNAARSTVQVIIVAAMVIALALLINSLIYDSSWDGQGYQSEGTLAIARGWNIYRENAPANAYFSQWLAFFSKGPWVTAGTLISWLNNAEAGKASAFILVAAALGSAYPAFKSLDFQPRTALFLALITAFNPISIAQVFTYYVDGQMASALTILVCLLILLERHSNRVLWIMLTAISILIVSLKLNGVIYLVIILGSYTVWQLFKQRDKGKKLIFSGFTACMIGIGFVSYNPFLTQYVPNLISNGNAFYPTTWTQLIFIEYNTPLNLRDKPAFTKLAYSVFSRYAGVGENTLKIPFTLSDEEFVWSVDARLSGFGPLFSGGIILGLMTLIAGNREGIRYPTFMLILLGGIMLSVIVNSEAWWARYVPQLWLLLILAIIPFLKGHASARWAWLTAGVMALNGAMLIFLMVRGTINNTASLQSQYMMTRQQFLDGKPIIIDFEGFALTQYHIDQLGIEYQSVTELPCEPETQQKLWPSEARLCNPPD
jgi:hypothetical protein